MDRYTPAVEGMMLRMYNSLNERDRRRYAAVEAVKLGHGGIEYVAQVVKCDPKTIHPGISELQTPAELSVERQRKKGWMKNAEGNVSAVDGQFSESASRPYRW